MSFKASKKRERKPLTNTIKGKQLIPNAAIGSWYKKQIRELMLEFVGGMRKDLAAASNSFAVEAYHVEDAAPADVYRKAMAKSKKRLNDEFTKKARLIAEQLVEKINGYSQATTAKSLEAMGLNMSVGKTPAIATIKDANVMENVRLITNLGQEAYTRIDMAVNQSLNSPDTSKHGMYGIAQQLQSVEGMSKQRAELIARDQNSKVYSAINNQRMKDAGLRTFEWIHSSAGKTPRPCHIERNGKIFSLDGGPAELYWPDGSDANPDFGARESDYGKPGYAINCIPGDSSIQFVNGCKKLYRRRFDGKLTVFITESGEIFRCTPNHPILTEKGWVAANSLNVGDDVIQIGHKPRIIVEGDDNQNGVSVADLFSFFERYVSVIRSGLATDFHGDSVIDQDVDVIDIERCLQLGDMTEFPEFVCNNFFTESDKSNLFGGTFSLDFFGIHHSASGGLSGESTGSSCLGAGVQGLHDVGLAAVAPLNFSGIKNIRNGGPTTIKNFGQLQNGFSGEILSANVSDGFGVVSKHRSHFLSSKVIEISECEFSDYVYNIEAKDGWYVANGIVTHNCRCRARPTISIDD